MLDGQADERSTSAMPSLVSVDRPGYVAFQRVKPPNALERDQHGTAAYALGCRCRQCRTVRNRADRNRRHLNRALNGQPVIYRCSTRPIEQHVEDLRRNGWTLRAIAEAAGMNVEAFRRALRKGTTWSTTIAAVRSVG
jgi:hypothetical protein